MFSQADPSITKRFGGTGLGLWICKQLCQKMGGNIEIYSQQNKGTIFVFYIPFKVSQSQSQPVSVSRSNSNIRALIVDDMLFNNKLHKAMLEKFGVECTMAQHGKEAVDIYTTKPKGYFHFIFMDLSMPVMDGKTACKAIRRFEEEDSREKIDIYIVSGNAVEDEVAACLNPQGSIQATRFFRKPIDMTIVKNIVQKYLQVDQTGGHGSNLKKKKTVLVIDEDKFYLGFLKKSFDSNSSVALLTATSESECLEVVEQKGQSIDMIFTDYEMTTLNGYELVDRIKKFYARKGQRQVPIVAISSHSDQEQLCRKAGFDDVLIMPVDDKTLENYIKTY